VNWIISAGSWAVSAWRRITGIASDIPEALHDMWRFVQLTLSGVQYIFTHPFTSVLNGFSLLAALVTGNDIAARNAIVRLVGWYDVNRTIPLRKQVMRWLAQLRARIAYLFAVAYLYINRLYRQSLAYTRLRVAIEHRAMIKAFQQSEAYTRQQVKAALALVQKEAATGYSATLHERASTVQRIADLVATRNPALRAAVSDIIRIVLDLLAIDNPVARLFAGFLIRECINRLGVDKVAGQLLADVAGPLLGNPKPKNLHDVIQNIGQRIGALESEWARFMESGGSQVEQAGKQWANMTGVLVDAAMLVFFADMVARPQQWAAEVSAAAGPVVHGATIAVARLLD
jgi:hypothetical protein